MIQTEQLTINNTSFIRTYSDANRYVVRDNISYEEAVDPAEFNRTYIEGDIIETPIEEKENEIQKLLNILIGEA